jgi:hypothetical protein
MIQSLKSGDREMELVRPRYIDPFNPVLVSPLSESFNVSQEQLMNIKEVLDICCSDSLFADKAYRAIGHILTNGPVVVPSINSLSPGSATIGDPSFTLHVMGKGFKEGSVIVFAGMLEPTTRVSDTELTTGVDMSVWLGPDSIPVMVQSSDGVLSDPVMFVFSPASITTTLGTTSTKSKPEVQKK